MNRRELMTASGSALLAMTAEGAPQMRPEMHPAKYASLEESSAKCVSTGEDCLRHCIGMMAMKDSSMAACAESVVELVAACRALQSLAAINSKHIASFAKDTMAVCADCEAECRKFYDKYATCKACADACKTCAAECRKIAG